MDKANSIPYPVTGFPEVGNIGTNSDLKFIVWAILAGILAVLIVFLFVKRSKK